MRQSQLFGATRREISQEEESINAILLTRGGYICRTAAGVTSFLPLGLRVIENIKNIVRAEMNELPATQELLMPVFQPKDIWEESGRWDDEGMKEVMYRVQDTNMGIGATHEENATDLFRKLVSSYKELPLCIYQIQTKFRKELRAKSGLLRGREFIMKDLYSFHLTEEGFQDYYEQAAAAYLRVFERCGVNAIRTKASGGIFSKRPSDEFQVINSVGEDTIYLNPAGDEAWNEEMVTGQDDPRLLEWGGGEVRPAQATEVGNIFPYGTRYTVPMHGEVTDETGQKVPVIMGAYGIGISRLMGVITELYGNVETGKIAWPTGIAPFKVHLIDLSPDGQGNPIYDQLKAAGVEVLFDDRDRRAGEKFADADLIGAPIRLIVSKRSLDAGGVEAVKAWNISPDEREIVAVSELENFIR